MNTKKFLKIATSTILALNIIPVYNINASENYVVEQEITIQKLWTGNVFETDIIYPVEGGNIYFNTTTKTITGADTTVTLTEIPREIEGVEVKIIGDGAFASTNITSISIPNTVTDIKTHAFSECYMLQSVEIPNSVENIGSNSFYCCVSLTRVNIPNSVINIGGGVFGECYALTTIELPKSVIGIGEWAFGECLSLEDVYYSGDQNDWFSMYVNASNEYLYAANIHFESELSTEPVIEKDDDIATEVTPEIDETTEVAPEAEVTPEVTPEVQEETTESTTQTQGINPLFIGVGAVIAICLAIVFKKDKKTEEN